MNNSNFASLYNMQAETGCFADKTNHKDKYYILYSLVIVFIGAKCFGSVVASLLMKNRHWKNQNLEIFFDNSICFYIECWHMISGRSQKRMLNKKREQRETKCVRATTLTLQNILKGFIGSFSVHNRKL